MEQKKKLRLFICYAHQDEAPFIEQFKKHTTPLKDNGLVDEWYDRKILPGEDYQNHIDNNLEDADIICLFISANFLSSESCKKEKRRALELRKHKTISIIPIILSPCGWLDDQHISKLLALPRDGTPVNTFKNMDEAWYDVYNGLKSIIQKEIKTRQIKITQAFQGFLQDTEMLTKAHSQKESVLLDDIFVHPELDKYSDLREYKEKIDSKELLKNLFDYPKVVIAGETLSGKTTLCKMIFKELRNRHLIPVYVLDKTKQFKGKIENKILHSFQEQYEGGEIKEIDKERIVPIIDDFHIAKSKEKHIRDLSSYPYCIIIVDDIFCLNIKDDNLIGHFNCFKIRELKPSLRYGLIKQWESLTDKTSIDSTLYKEIDRTVELIESTLGKIIGKGVMPSYPFYILSAIVTYETFNMPLDQEITSQGYCYQALIYFYLRKKGVRNDEMDIYINVLTEISFYFFREKKSELLPDDFTSFMKGYLEKYNLPIKEEILLRHLSSIILVDSFNNYSFRYLYLYYFFVAKYLSEHIEDNGMKNIMVNVMQNLHVDENAYIAIFMTHHSKNIEILNEIEVNALRCFNNNKPATLMKDEVAFFDEAADIIIKAVLPPANRTAEKERTERLKRQDEMEQSEEKAETKGDIDREDDLEIELRGAIKTVEVMGCIIKNRAGSLEKTKLKDMFKDAMNVHLRILSSFFKLIEGKEDQKGMVDFISERLRRVTRGKREKLGEEKLKEISRAIFWNLNLFVVFGIISKIIHSLGSDKLTEIVNEVCNEINTPASFIVKHGILMWYKKNLQIEELVAKIEAKEFSLIPERIIKLLVVNHCALHQINYKDRQRIVNKLGVPAVKLLTRS